jgi:hypothetical protein
MFECQKCGRAHTMIILSDPNSSLNVASWHKCEVSRRLQYFRKRGKNGSDSDIAKVTRLTRTGSRAY